MKHVLSSAITITATLALAACQGSLVSRVAEESFGPDAVAVLSSPAEAATTFLVDAIAETNGSFTVIDSELDSLPPGTPFSVTATEAEIKSMLEQALGASGYGEGILIEDVRLDEGQIEASFTLELPPFDTAIPGSAVVVASIDGEGNPVVSIASAEFSHLKAPAESLGTLNQALSEAIADAQDNSGMDVRLTGLLIDDGTVVVSGYTE